MISLSLSPFKISVSLIKRWIWRGAGIKKFKYRIGVLSPVVVFFFYPCWLIMYLIYLNVPLLKSVPQQGLWSQVGNFKKRRKKKAGGIRRHHAISISKWGEGTLTARDLQLIWAPNWLMGNFQEDGAMVERIMKTRMNFYFILFISYPPTLRAKFLENIRRKDNTCVILPGCKLDSSSQEMGFYFVFGLFVCFCCDPSPPR